MAIILSDNIQVNAPKPVDSRYLNILVPYSSTTAANIAIVSGVRFTGLTVNILGTEYWYKDGIADSCLVLKSSTSNIVNVCNPAGLTYSATTSNDFIGVSGGSTVWLPTISVCNGQKITVADIQGNASISPISICSSGYKILNGYCAAINTNYGSVSFIYNGKNFWSATAFIN